MLYITYVYDTRKKKPLWESRFLNNFYLILVQCMRTHTARVYFKPITTPVRTIIFKQTATYADVLIQKKKRKKEERNITTNDIDDDTKSPEWDYRDVFKFVLYTLLWSVHGQGRTLEGGFGRSADPQFFFFGKTWPL